MAQQDESLQGKTLCIIFTGEVTKETAQELIGEVLDAVERGVEEVHLALSTVGGDVEPAMVIYNLLRGLSCPVTTYNIGLIGSVGNIVFLAGQKRYAAPNATFVFHGFSFTQEEDATITASAARRLADYLEASQQHMREMLAAHTNSDILLDGLFEETERYFDARWAQKHGLVDAVEGFTVPADSLILPIPAMRPDTRPE